MSAKKMMQAANKMTGGALVTNQWPLEYN